MRTSVITIMVLGLGAVLASACANGGAAGAANDDDSTLTTGGGDATGGMGGDPGEGGAGGTNATGGSGGEMVVSAVASSSSSSSSSSGGMNKPEGCGNGMLEESEACDGSLFGGKDCTNYGLSGGSLQCNEYCAIVLTQCTPAETCGNLFDDDQDGKTDCEDEDCAMQSVCTDSCGQATTLVLPAFEFGSTLGAPVVLSPGCASSSGSERVYSFTATKDAKYSIELYSFFYPMVLAVRTECANGQSENGCSSMAAFEQKLTVQGVKGTTYYVIADAVTGQPDDFQITIAETN